MSRTPPDPIRGPRSTPALALLALAGVLLFALFAALGVWQIERRAWKLALIERVEARVHAAPIDMPVPARWPRIGAADDEYRHVRLAGVFLHERETLPHYDLISDLSTGRPLKFGERMLSSAAARNGDVARLFELLAARSIPPEHVSRPGVVFKVMTASLRRGRPQSALTR